MHSKLICFLDHSTTGPGAGINHHMHETILTLQICYIIWQPHEELAVFCEAIYPNLLQEHAATSNFLTPSLKEE